MSDFTEQFIKDVADHKMTVIRDDGVYRHIHCGKPGDSNQYFEIITWPGSLCYTGDMGTYVFERTDDMFEFFRGGGDRPLYRISMGYWAEKLQAIDTHGKYEEFSYEVLKKGMAERFEQWCKNQLLDGIDKPAINGRRVMFDIMIKGLQYEEDEIVCRQVIDDFEFEGSPVFTDTFEFDFSVYTHHYKWCCHALRWAINEYDKAKEVAA